jgi:hypothetical protein
MGAGGKGFAGVTPGLKRFAARPVYRAGKGRPLMRVGLVVVIAG